MTLDVACCGSRRNVVSGRGRPVVREVGGGSVSPTTGQPPPPACIGVGGVFRWLPKCSLVPAALCRGSPYDTWTAYLPRQRQDSHRRQCVLVWEGVFRWLPRCSLVPAALWRGSPYDTWMAFQGLSRPMGCRGGVNDVGRCVLWQQAQCRQRAWPSRRSRSGRRICFANDRTATAVSVRRCGREFFGGCPDVRWYRQRCGGAVPTTRGRLFRDCLAQWGVAVV